MAIPSPTIEFEFTAGTWTSASGRIRKPLGLTITRGRENELAPVSPSEASFTLQNNDGLFTQGVSAYPIRRFVPVRISTSGRRFTGYVDSWSVGIQQRGKLSDCTVQCVDRKALDDMRTLSGHAREVIATMAPLAYWNLTGDPTGGQVLGGAAAPLIPRYAGASDGELGWGSGEVLPGDEAGGVQFTPALDETTQAMTGGYRLESLYTPPTSYSVIVMYGKSLRDGPLLRLGGAKVDMSGGAAFFVTSTGSVVPLSSSVEVLSIDASGVILSSDPTRQYYTPATALSSTQVGGTMVAGVASWSGASVSHVAVVPRVAPGDMAALVNRLSLAPDSPETIVGNLLQLSGAGAATVTRQGSTQSVVGLPTAGQSAQAVIDQMAFGALARYFIDANGAPCWQSWDYAPSVVSQPADAGVMPDLVYEVDISAWVTDVTTSLPSGGSWTFSDTSGIARSSLDIQHVVATDAEARAVATYIVDRSTDKPRLKGVSFDLLRLPSGQATTLLGLELGSRVLVSGLPTQLPSPQTVMVEGISETLTENSWSLTLTTSPSPAFDWFAWGNAWGSKPWKPF